VQGNVSINLDSTPLSETVQSTNYNPTGAPYPWPTGTTNTLLTDTYPSDLRGLMYATGNVKFQSDASLGQVVCGGTVTYTNTAISFNYTSDYVNNPPPGFYDVDMTASSMTWTQLTN
jgi:hypothetical protein